MSRIMTIEEAHLGEEPFAESHSGLLLPRRFARRRTAVDLFCGAGGFSLGFINAGFEVVAGLDNDPVCCITYMHNLGAYPCELHFVAESDRQALEKALGRSWGGKTVRRPITVPVSGGGWRAHHPDHPGVSHFWLGDCRKIAGRDILDAAGIAVGELDCVMGGPPCQGFSVAGKRDVMDPRNSLVFEFARLVCEMRPKTFVMENVPGMLSITTVEGIPVVDAFCRVIEDGGFASFDGIRQMLLAQAGRAAGFRGTKSKRGLRRRRNEAEEPESAEEPDALDEAVSAVGAGPLFAAGGPP